MEPLLPTELLKTWENSALNFPPKKKHTYHGLIETTIRFMKITQNVPFDATFHTKSVRIALTLFNNKRIK